VSLAGWGPVPVGEGEAGDVVRERGWREEGCTLGRGSGALGCGSDAAWERAEGEGVGLLASGPGEGRELGQEGRGWAGQQALGWVWTSSFLFLFLLLF